MAVVQHAPVVEPSEVGVRRRLWTRDEYYRMAEVGIIGPDERVELIDGEVLLKVTQHHPHVTSVYACAEAARAAFGPGHWIRSQCPLALGQYSDPESDVAVVVGSPDEYDDHPTSALLVIEVAEATLAADRRMKASLYAWAGLPEYWIVNLIERQLEVLRDPGELPSGEVGYRSREVARPGQTVRPLAKPDAAVAVEALLPKAR